MLARTERFDRDRLDRAFEATHTTSPSGTIIASIDAARALLERDGERLLGRTIALVAEPGAAPVGAGAGRPRRAARTARPDPPGRGARRHRCRRAGRRGRPRRSGLRRRAGRPRHDRGDGDDGGHADTVGPFVDALVASIERRRSDPREVVRAVWLGEGSTPEVALAPREAFFAPHETVRSAEATGRVAAELVAPYPPGIPAVVPGEVLTAEVLDALQAAAARGVRVAYAADPTMATVQVVPATPEGPRPRVGRMVEAREPARPSGSWMLQHARGDAHRPAEIPHRDRRSSSGMSWSSRSRRHASSRSPTPTRSNGCCATTIAATASGPCSTTRLALVTGQGLLTADLDPWRENRRIQQPAFQHAALEPLAATVVAAADRLLAPVGPRARRLARRRRRRDDAGRPRGRGRGAVLHRPGRQRGHLGRRGPRCARPGRRPEPRTRWRCRSVCPRPATRGCVGPWPPSTPRSPSWSPAAGPPTTRSDLLGLLLRAGLPDQQVRDEVVTTLVAGHETVASAMTWAWDLLGRRDVRDRLLDEVDVVLGPGPGGRAPGWSDYATLTWTRQVLDETLRLYPPAWVVTRRALADDVLAGVAVPEGALVILSTYALHRNPGLARPRALRPRALRPRARGRLQRSAYAPFGSGPRLCIGRDFALLEATLLLARVSQRYVLRPSSRRPVRADALVTIRPRQGLRMRLERRAG